MSKVNPAYLPLRPVGSLGQSKSASERLRSAHQALRGSVSIIKRRDFH